MTDKPRNGEHLLPYQGAPMFKFWGFAGFDVFEVWVGRLPDDELFGFSLIEPTSRRRIVRITGEQLKAAAFDARKAAQTAWDAQVARQGQKHFVATLRQAQKDFANDFTL